MDPTNYKFNCILVSEIVTLTLTYLIPQCNTIVIAIALEEIAKNREQKPCLANYKIIEQASHKKTISAYSMCDILPFTVKMQDNPD